MTKSPAVIRLLKGIGVLIAFCLVLFIALFLYQTSRPVKLDNLALVSLEGTPVLPDSLFATKHTVLNFWATWCKPCIEEMPMLDSVYQTMDKAKWQILLISEESPEKLKAFQSKHNFSMPFLRSEEPLSTLGIAALPKTIVVDEKANVLYSKTGGLTMDAAGMLETLKELLIRK